MHVLVGPVHLGDVHQALDALLDLDEGAVVGEVGDLAEQARALRVAARNADPRILAELLQAERDAVLLLIELEHLRRHLVAHVEHFRGMAHAAPGQIGDVQQAVDAAEVHESAVVGDVLDDALDDGAFLQVGEQLLALFTGGGFQHGAARNNDVVALAVELDDLEFEFLVLVGRGVLDRAHVDQRAGQEGADAVGHDRQAALHLAVDDALHQGAFVERLLQVVPGGDALGLLARQAGLAIAVLEHLDGDADIVARLDLELAAVIAEFFDIDEALGLESGVDNHEVLVDAHHFGGDHFTLRASPGGTGFLRRVGQSFRFREQQTCILPYRITAEKQLVKVRRQILSPWEREKTPASVQRTAGKPVTVHRGTKGGSGRKESSDTLRQCSR
jgi:hypothetical protein